MFSLITQDLVDRYASDERIRRVLDCAGPLAAGRTQQWMRNDAAKRTICALLYGDLLEGLRGLRILDIGGGASMLVKALAQRHDFTLIDLLAHDDAEVKQALCQTLGDGCFVCQDWWQYKPEPPFDIVIANDLFPNVDQRLAEFLERYLPVCRELRVSLTYYPETRFYLTRRIDGEEVLCVRAWDGEQTGRVLARYASRIDGWNQEVFKTSGQSLFANGRQVCIATIKGDL